MNLTCLTIINHFWLLGHYWNHYQPLQFSIQWWIITSERSLTTQGDVFCVGNAFLKRVPERMAIYDASSAFLALPRFSQEALLKVFYLKGKEVPEVPWRYPDRSPQAFITGLVCWWSCSMWAPWTPCSLSFLDVRGLRAIKPKPALDAEKVWPCELCHSFNQSECHRKRHFNATTLQGN